LQRLLSFTSEPSYDDLLPNSPRDAGMSLVRLA